MVKAIATETGATQVLVNKVLTSLEAQTVSAIERGEKVQLTGFINVRPVHRAARKGFDPIKKVAMDIEPTVGVSVKAGEKLKKASANLKVTDFEPAVKETEEA